MVAQSGSEVNRLLDWRLVQRLPAIDAAHGDLPRGHQGPEQHGRRFRVGQRALGLNPALELPVQAFDGVGGPQGLPLPRWIAQEGEQPLLCLFQAVRHAPASEPPLGHEGLARLAHVLGVLGVHHVGVVGLDLVVQFLRRMGHPNFLEVALGFALYALGQLVEHVGGLVDPAALLAGVAVDLAQGFPEAERAVAGGKLGATPSGRGV